MNKSKLNNSKTYKPKTDLLYFGLGAVVKNIIPELKVSYSRGKQFLGKVNSASDVADFIRTTYAKDQIELQEAVVILYLNTANEIIGYYKHSVGVINATLVDVRIVFSVALRCLATSMIVSHNHPSGSLKPSKMDIELTEDLAKAASTLQIQLLDHVIVTKYDYYSFADHNKL